MKTLRDAVHGDMRFERREMDLIDTPAMQRLRGIKQLGASHLVFPSAVHTRFEHSLGTCWMTKRLLTALEEAGCTFSPGERETACLAALLHDVTHIPFGHTFEDERRLFHRHDEDHQRLQHFLETGPLADALRQSENAAAVMALLGGRDLGRPFVRQLVSGTVCADLLDYLRRDALFCGLRLDYDERLFHYFTLVDGQLAFSLHKRGQLRRDAVSELVHLLQMRYTLTERVYFHHAKIVAGAMISRALELALVAGLFVPRELNGLRDDSFMALLEMRANSPARIAASRSSGLSDLLEDLGTRRLYRRVYLTTLAGLGKPGLSPEQRDELAQRFYHDLPHRQQTERELAATLGVPEGHVIVYCPSPKMSLKEADVLVETGGGGVEPLSSLGHPDVEALKEKHRGLWRFYVCVRRGDDALARRAARLCEEIFGYPNQTASAWPRAEDDDCLAC